MRLSFFMWSSLQGSMTSAASQRPGPGRNGTWVLRRPYGRFQARKAGNRRHGGLRFPGRKDYSLERDLGEAALAAVQRLGGAQERSGRRRRRSGERARDGERSTRLRAQYAREDQGAVPQQRCRPAPVDGRRVQRELVLDDPERHLDALAVRADRQRGLAGPPALARLDEC